MSYQGKHSISNKTSAASDSTRKTISRENLSVEKETRVSTRVSERNTTSKNRSADREEYISARPVRSVTAAPSHTTEKQLSAPARPSRVTSTARSASYRSSTARRKQIPLWPFLVAFLLLALFAGWKLAGILFGYRDARQSYEDVASRAITVNLPAQTIAPDGTVVEYVLPDAVPITVDWDALRAENPDIVAWLYCEGTIINYPVVQTTDNDKYLKTGFSGQTTDNGCLFVDYNSRIGVTASNLIIYGHNMKDESMFGTLKNYVNKSYFDEHPALFLLTPDGNYRIELACCRIVEATKENFPVYFNQTVSYASYLDKISTDCFWLSDDFITADYQLVTLSTCTSAAGYDDPRLLVQGSLVPLVG